MYPLRFEPLFRRYLWGGRRLAEMLNKPIGDLPAAESWEVVDHQDDQSVVRYGTLAGKSLRQLILESGKDLIGENLLSQISSLVLPPHLQNRFPLLLKFLDANQHLSVQVHPDDRMAATLRVPDLGKTEAWYVMYADPGSRIYAGLKQGVSRESFAAAVANGETESTLHSFEPKQGDCIFIPAGTIHAIGEGLLICEIQQASNTTFRVYDWGRVEKDGRARPLHIPQAIEATDFVRGPVDPQPTQPTGDPYWNRLVSCNKFAMNRGKLNQPSRIGGDGRFRILALTSGSVSIAGDPSGQPMEIGETSLLPACLDPTELTPGPNGVELLEIYVPNED